MLLFINLGPLFWNITLGIIALRIIFLILKMVNINSRTIKHIFKIILHIFVIVLLFFHSGFYQFHFAYDINDFYTEETLTPQTEIIENLDSFKLVTQEILTNYELLLKSLRMDEFMKRGCVNYQKLNQKSKRINPEKNHRILNKMLVEKTVKNFSLCSDSTFTFKVGSISSSGYSDFEEKHHFTIHQLIYHPQGKFIQPTYYSTFIGSEDTKINSQWIYRIEKHWKQVW
ncbi:MAG: hypothetical protein AB8F94_13690 [Saprospiraceae bacterium]